MGTFRIKEAADLLEVSGDTLRRWADAGRIETITESSGRLAVAGVALGREPGMLAIAAVKATNVSVEIPRIR